MDEAREEMPSDLTKKERREIKEVFGAARELLPSPARWTKGAYARNSRGEPVSAFAPNATRFCISGALIRASFTHYGELPDRRFTYLAKPEDVFEFPLAVKAFNYLGMFM